MKLLYSALLHHSNNGPNKGINGWLMQAQACRTLTDAGGVPQHANDVSRRRRRALCLAVS